MTKPNPPILILSLALLLMAEVSSSSTFVGNGASAADLELRITLNHIQETFKDINKNNAEGLCTCPPMLKDSKICGNLKNLNQAQIKLCAESIILKKSEILAFTKPNTAVDFHWSIDDLVAKENRKERPVDAVTTRSPAPTVTIDRSRFLGFGAETKVALLTHELFHLVKIEGKYVEDTQPFGAFTSPDGGQQFLDAVGAAATIHAINTRSIKAHRVLRHISKYYRPFEFSIYAGSSDEFGDTSERLLLKSTSNTSGFKFTYRPESIAWRIGFDYSGSDDSTEEELTAEESINFFSMGMGYHYRPFTESISYASQIHVSADADLLYGSASYEVSDEAGISIDDKSQVWGTQAGISVHIPIFFGFWGTVGLQIRNLQYNYEKIGENISKFQHHSFLGVGYAF